jgi:hypothetical protein
MYSGRVGGVRSWAVRWFSIRRGDVGNKLTMMPIVCVLRAATNQRLLFTPSRLMEITIKKLPLYNTTLPLPATLVYSFDFILFFRLADVRRHYSVKQKSFLLSIYSSRSYYFPLIGIIKSTSV